MAERKHDGDFSERLQGLQKVSDSKSYIQTLKQVLAEIKKDERYRRDSAVTETIVSIYYRCKPKSPVRRVLVSYIESLAVDDKLFIRHCLQDHLTRHMEIPSDKLNNLSHLRSQVETISSLIENFPTGEECLFAVGIKVLKFLAEVLSSILKTFSESLSPVQMNEIMHHCLATIQTSNRLLQKSVAMTTNPCSGQENRPLQEMITQYLESDVYILLKGDFLSDCRCGCAMNIALLLRLAAADKLPHLLMSVMFSRVVPSCALAQYTLPDWLAVSEITKLDVTSLPVVSQLCLIFGLLAKLDLSELMVEITPGKTLMTCVFLDELLTFSKKCSDTASKVLLAKTITLWTSRMCTGLECKVVPSYLYSSLSGEGTILKDILQYIWTTWDDQIDVIRQNAKNTFESSIKIHILATQTDAKSDVFILRVTRELLAVSWSNKGKCGSLAVMATILGVSHLLELCPLIGTELIEQLKEQMSASQASDLHDKLCQCHQAECVARDSADSDRHKTWLALWCVPVITALCGDHKLQKTTIIEYILPKLLKTSKTVLPYLIEQLTVTTTPTRSQTCALIICLRRARSLGQLHHPVESSGSGDTTLWYGLVRVDVLKYALTSMDDQVRLDAFALLCENNKTTEPISELEFDLVRYFLPHNLNNQSPGFRQHLLSYVQKLFQRMKESWQTLVRLMRNKKDEKKCEEVDHNMTTYQEFVLWLEAVMFNNIRFGSAFPRRTTCLLILSLMVDCAEQMSDLCTNQLFMLVSRLGQTQMQTLLDCLTDSFEENKMAATKILSASMKQGFGHQSQTQVESLFTSALELSSSNKPQDCTTAAYLFKYLLQQPSIVLVMKMSAPGFTTSVVASSDPVIDRSPTLHLLSILLVLLRDELCDARKSLTLAAANRPMYPTLHCIRYILSETDYKSISAECLPSWRKLSNDLIQLCLDLSQVVSPVVQASSPEGNVPLDIIKSLNLNVDSGNTNRSTSEEDSSDKIVTLMPEFLVVCCWRTIKEVSLVFGHICQNVPVTGSASHDGVINTQQLFMIGDYFKNQLLESIHRGAFELAYAGFVQMCDMLWRSSLQQLHQLPSQWLHAVLSDIRGNNSTLCATRRSAGIPFYVQALVSTEPTLTGRTCFKSAITALLSLALRPGDSTDAQVHSLNILRALFRDTRLGEDVAPYITEGLTAAVLGFKSRNWAVRNSSTLLLSALMTRVFGVKRSKDESAISKKNCQTGRAFFHRYPTLYQFLLNELTEATQNIDCSEHIQLHPSLYPVLMVLGRLFPSSLEGADTNLNLAEFIPFIIKCASSPVYKTRMMAAKALQPLVQKDQLTSVLVQLMMLVPTSSANQIKQSRLHGILLQIEHLLLMVCSSQSDFLQEQTLQTVASTWMQCVWFISRTNICLVTRKSAFNICDLLLTLGSADDTLMVCLRQAVITSLRLEISSELVNTSQPFVHEFMTTVTQLCLKYVADLQDNLIDTHLQDTHLIDTHLQDTHLIDTHLQDTHLQDDLSAESDLPQLDHQAEMENVIVTLLSSKLYEVRLEVLTSLSNHFSCEDSTGKRDSATSQRCSFNPRLVGCSRSKTIFKQLLSMGLQTEEHHSCFTMVFETLKNYPAIEDFLEHEDVEAIFKELLRRLCNEPRSEVKSSIIAFSGVVLSEVYAHLTQMKSSDLYEERDLAQSVELSLEVQDRTSSVDVFHWAIFRSNQWSTIGLSKAMIKSSDLYDSVAEWCCCIKSCSQSDQSAQLQISCAKAIRYNVIILLVDPYSVLGSLTFDVWEIVISLLQEDDLEVKDVTSSIFPVLDGGSLLADVQPTLALNLLLAKMVQIHGSRDRAGCIRTLVAWIKDSDSSNEDLEERLFDRGEINTYREDVLLVQRVAEQLGRLIQNTSSKSAADPSETSNKGNTSSKSAVDPSETSNKGNTSSKSAVDPSETSNKGNTSSKSAVDPSETSNKGNTSSKSAGDPSETSNKGNTSSKSAGDPSETSNKGNTSSKSAVDPSETSNKGNTSSKSAADPSETSNKGNTSSKSAADPSETSNKGTRTDQELQDHCVSYTGDNHTSNKRKIAVQGSLDHPMYPSGDASQTSDKGNITDQVALNHCMSSSGDASQTSDKGNITDQVALNHCMSSSGDVSLIGNTGDISDPESLDHCVISVDDHQNESLISGLLEYFCVKLKNMDVICPVSPFKDSVVYEASLKTLLMATSVVKCVKHISKTGKLQVLYDELQLVLNSRCDPSHVFLDGCF